jgi:hypothetical protein
LKNLIGRVKRRPEDRVRCSGDLFLCLKDEHDREDSLSGSGYSDPTIHVRIDPEDGGEPMNPDDYRPSQV